jgi:hypothetical protein
MYPSCPTLPQRSHALNLTHKWHIRRTAAWAIMRLCKQGLQGFTSGLTKLAILPCFDVVYSHAVASHLATSPTMAISTQLSHPERYVRRPTTVERLFLMHDRVSSPYSSGYSPTPYWSQQATPSIPHLMPDERYTSPTQSNQFSTPVVPPTLPHATSPTSTTRFDRQLSGTSRGPLAPAPLSQPRWARSEAQLVQDIYGRHG